MDEELDALTRVALRLGLKPEGRTSVEIAALIAEHDASRCKVSAALRLEWYRKIKELEK